MVETSGSQPACPDTRGLLERLRGGDRGAAEPLFTLHRSRLLRAVRLRLPEGLRGLVEADDVCQTACLKALRSLDRFEHRGEGSFLAWLVRIAERAIHDAVRSGQRTPVPTSADGSALLARTESPSRAAIRHEDQELLQRAMDTLRVEDRELLIDHELLGVELDELGVRLGRSSEAVRLLIYRAKNKLAAWFEQHG